MQAQHTKELFLLVPLTIYIYIYIYIWNLIDFELHWISPKMPLSLQICQPKHCRVHVLSRLDYCKLLLAGSPKYLLSKLQNVQNSAARCILEHLDPPMPLLWFILFTSHLLSRGSNTELSLVCFKIISQCLISPPSTLQKFFTFTFLPSRHLSF